ncbi:MAG TPA: GTPase Era [Vicinamibacterales bacterium]|nr:GTPase Era [Vicinamibacterales bacterium]
MKSGFVSLLGRPNAGKSSLLNRIVGVKLAIVSDKPQTTRNSIRGVKNYPAGQIVFVDTPGIHRPLHRMNVRMVDSAVESIGQVDVVGAVVDASEKTGAGTRFLIDLLRNTKAATVLILNKIDVVSKKRLLPLIDQLHKEREWTHIVPVSALTGENVDRLEQVLLDSLPEGDQLYPDDYLTDQPERALVAEMVREQVLRLTHAEIPFATAVLVDQFEELKEGKLLRIYCSIFVERDSQKPIIIGRAGELIKQIGTAARQEIEKFFHTKVFLDLRVAVRESWRDDERLLDNLGVKPPSFNR